MSIVWLSLTGLTIKHRPKMNKASFHESEWGFVKSLLLYEPGTGIFTWKVNRAYIIKAGEVAGCDHQGYTRITVAGRAVLAHRLAWFYVHGKWPEMDIDHVNRSLSDNRISNLRLCTHSENMANKKTQVNNKADLKGVSWDKKSNKWRAQIAKDGKKFHLGFFVDPSEAHAAYVSASIQKHGQFARAA